MKLEVAPLENAFVRLAPLGEAHREPLRAACAADTEIWAALYPYSMAGEHFDPRFNQLLTDAGRGQTMPFAVLARGKVVGLSCFLAVDPINASVEIGGTYYRPDVRGGVVNPAAKRLLFGHAFACGARRVQLKVDALNARSCAAVLKLGAVQEGILRQDRVTWTGRVRDTVCFSVLADEWPRVREGLDRRLAR
ncbi:MAG TPA: GNAT family protein [Phenylobacterium sp.]|uniref:GNAT family N-acetyltransferase n=1 Tax=Phenylobacterium sp. TaxID=1871053 RepID=UPI002B488254|nr:GNAT family protein [Phenylobacterium sp.]HKR88981.1 GNAT family protein [Phenylobacterium sp.]